MQIKISFIQPISPIGEMMHSSENGGKYKKDKH
jgi:hypothetical protein